MKGRLFTAMGICGIIATLIVTSSFVSSSSDLRAPFVVLGILMSIIVMALGEMIVVFEQKNGGNKNVGIYDENHYSTVYDMAVIMKAAIKNEWCKNNNIPLIRIPYTKLGNIKFEDLFGNEYLVKEGDFSD